MSSESPIHSFHRFRCLLPLSNLFLNLLGFTTVASELVSHVTDPTRLIPQWCTTDTKVRTRRHLRPDEQPGLADSRALSDSRHFPQLILGLLDISRPCQTSHDLPNHPSPNRLLSSRCETCTPGFLLRSSHDYHQERAEEKIKQYHISGTPRVLRTDQRPIRPSQPELTMGKCQRCD